MENTPDFSQMIQKELLRIGVKDTTLRGQHRPEMLLQLLKECKSPAQLQKEESWFHNGD